MTTHQSTQPPLIKLAYRRCRNLLVRSVRTVSTFSDLRSVYLRLRLACISAKPESGVVRLRIRHLGNHSVYCRPATTDIQVLEDTFFNKYHRLPHSADSPTTILDLGANIGLTVADYACLYPQASVVGVEMDADNARIARLNIKPFSSRCSIFTAAIWTSDEMVSYGGGAEWGYHVQSAGSDPARGTVQAYSITSLMDKLGWKSVDLVKMDIEGAELDLLKNAESWIHRIATLKVELHGSYTVQECTYDLRRLGLQCEADPMHPRAVIAYNHRATAKVGAQ